MSYLRNKVYQKLIPVVQSFKDGALATFGGPSGLLDYLPDTVPRHITTYPEHDLQNLSFVDNRFAFTITDCVLEHVPKPWLAVQELERVTSQVLIVIVPCFHNYHPHPIDAWRFLPDCVPILFTGYYRVDVFTHGSAALAEHYVTHTKREPAPQEIMDQNDPKWPMLMGVVCYMSKAAYKRYHKIFLTGKPDV